VVLSPYVFIDYERFRDLLLTMQVGVTFARHGLGLRLPALLDLCVGWPALALAAVGLLAAGPTRPRTVILAAFPVAYLLMLAPSPSIFARYLSVVTPMIALFAGHGAAVLGTRILSRGPLLGTLLIAALAAAAQARESIAQVRLLARDDTRHQSARWIEANVPPGTSLTLPNAVWYPNPSISFGAKNIKLFMPEFASALAARGVPDPQRSYPLRFHKFFWANTGDEQRPTPIIVTAHHPAAMPDLHAEPELGMRLTHAGARPAARFFATPLVVPPDVVFDPLGEYVPLRGAAHILRLGPNITIWRINDLRAATRVLKRIYRKKRTR
jgi:hypothetical protein